MYFNQSIYIHSHIETIEAQKDGKSLMPSGLTEKPTQKELVDLVRFLSELGKVGEFSIGKERLARRWQVLSDTDAARYRLRRTSFDSVTKDDPAYTWIPAYSKVSGVLPLAEIPRVGLNLNLRGKVGMGFLRTELEVTQAGVVELTLNHTEGLLGWIGTKPIEVQDVMTLDLEPGRHWVTFAVELDKRDADVRLELSDSPGSAAQAQFVTEK